MDIHYIIENNNLRMKIGPINDKIAKEFAYQYTEFRIPHDMSLKMAIKLLEAHDGPRSVGWHLEKALQKYTLVLNTLNDTGVFVKLGGSATCTFCAAHSACWGCFIKEITGKAVCMNTPWPILEQTANMLDSEIVFKMIADPEYKHKDRLKACLSDMVDFIRRII